MATYTETPPLETPSLAHGVAQPVAQPIAVRFRQFAGRTRKVAKYLIGQQAFEPSVAAYDDDVWFVSYPRSGNTYWRFLTANLLVDNDVVDWTNIERLVPDIYITSDSELRRLPRPRYLKSHEPYRPAYRRVIMIVRDPRDVAVSCFHFMRKKNGLPPNASIDSFVHELIAGRYYSYGNWSENVGSWMGAREGTPDFTVFRYEEMLRDTYGELTRLAKALGLPADTARISRAIENSRADRLRSLETPQRRYHKFLRQTRSDVPYVRAAREGQWQEALSAESVRAIENAYGKLMSRFGYL